MPLTPVSKRDPTVAAVLRGWRRLTGGARAGDELRRTLVACSGGADSTGLALALRAAGGLAGLAHVVHDLRPGEEALADRDWVRGLAAELGTDFYERRVRVMGMAGNVEALARRARYAALAEMAGEAACRWVATGHQADDQFETILMRLARGAGPRGLGGIPGKRGLRGGVTVIRPCLAVRRAGLAGLCGRAGVEPREDATNADRAFARNAVRAVAAPELERLYPGAVERADELARRMRQMAAAIGAAAATLEADGAPDRAVLAAAPRAVAHAVLRRAAVRAGAGEDRLGWRTGDAIVTAIRDGRGGERRFAWGGAAVVVAASVVRIELA